MSFTMLLCLDMGMIIGLTSYVSLKLWRAVAHIKNDELKETAMNIEMWKIERSHVWNLNEWLLICVVPLLVASCFELFL